MGGKQKQSQRTKGNVQASSSARAAQVLESMGGFQGFDALGGDLGFVPVAQSMDDPDSSVDSDFRMLLRKLTKKDMTTKVKALQDIASLCTEKPVDDIKSVLPFWPRIYSRLSIDHERRVREATQFTHKELVQQVGRDMAPYLKTIVGPWLVARGDPYGPAATAASSAFTEAFSAHKQKDVLVYCKDDIMSHIEDNILKQTAETLSDKSVTEPEDMQTKYERTVASSLSAWRMFLLTAPPQTDVEPVYGNILKDQQFWKLPKHQSELIRSTFYCLLSGLCQIHPEIISKFSDKAFTCTLYRLDETSKQVTPALWEATLYVVSVVKDWYQNISLKKGFWPKLFKVLSVGGEASCQIIFPNILPLFSKLPIEVISGSDTSFLDKYCESIEKSLLTEGESGNQKNIDTIVTSLVECVRFCIIKNIHQEEEEILTLLTDKLGDLLKASVREESPCLSESPLYRDVASLLWYLHKQLSDHTENSIEKQMLKKALSKMWSTIDETCVLPVQEGVSQDKAYILKRVSVLIIALHPHRNKVRLKETGSEASVKETGPTSQIMDSISQHSELFGLVSGICKESYSGAVKDQSERHLQLLCQVLNCYKDSDLFLYLRKISGDESTDCSGEQAPVETLIDDIFLPMLQWVQEDETRESLISVIVGFVIISLHIEHIPVMLEKVLMASKPDVHQLCVLTKELLDSENSDIVAWLSGPVFGSVIVECIKNFCCDVKTTTFKRDSLKMDDRLNLFRLVVHPTKTEDCTLGCEHIDSIVTEIHGLLPGDDHILPTDAEQYNNCIALACELAKNIFLLEKYQSRKTDSLLLTFFKLDCLALSTIDSDIRGQVLNTWQEAAKVSLLHGTFISKAGSVFFTAASLLKDTMSSGTVDMKKLAHLCCVGQSLLLCISDTDSRLAVFTELLLPFHHPDHWNLHLVTSGSLPIVTDKPVSTGTTQTGILNSLAAVYFNGKLHAVLRHHANGSDDHDMDKVSFSDYQLQLYLGLALFELCCSKEVTTEAIPSGSVIHSFLEKELSQLLAQDEEESLEICRRMLNLSLCEGGLWVQGLRVILEKATGKVTYTDLQSILGPVERLCEVESQTRLHTNLVVMVVLSQNELQDLIGCTAASLMSLPTEEADMVKGSAAQLALLTTAVELLCQKELTGSATQVLQDVTNVVTVIQGWKDTFDTLFLFESSLVEVEWSCLSFCSQCIRFLTAMIQYGAKWLSPEQWDFIMCAMLSWLQSCQESSPEVLSPSSVGIHLFSVQTYSLLRQISLAMEHYVTLGAEEKSAYPPELHNEWHEFFSQGAYSITIPMLIKCADAGQSVNPKVLRCVSDAACLCPVTHLLHQQLPAKLMATDKSGLPDSLQTLLNYFTAMMLMHSKPLQVVAYTLLIKLVPEISKYEEKRSSPEKEQEAETYQPPQGLWDTTEMCRETLMTWFVELGIRIGDKWVPGEGSEEQSITVGYIYSWLILLELCKEASPTMRACYAAYLRDSGAIDALMSLLFCSMPRNPVICSIDESNIVMSPAAKFCGKSLFAEPVSSSVRGYWSEQDVSHMACTMYFSVLEELPALVRQWYNAQDRRVTELTDRFTSKFVSPLLCEKQLTEVRQEIINSETLKVKTRPVTREVIAVYSLDDASIELVVTLPPNHPLGPVTVEQGKKIGIANNQWRNWMLQLTTFLQHQNGTIMKGLLLWKKNVDKKFEGVEECYICFSIIHGTTCQLPKLQCRTCKKKFHSSCLYKWFTTSNKATCPLCRNLF